MSRVAKKPILLPKGVEIKMNGSIVYAKGAKGSSELNLHPSVQVEIVDNQLVVKADLDLSNGSYALAGTMRALLNNLVMGVSVGFERKLQLIGVGYKAQAQGASLNLSLGFSHSIVHQMPKDVTCETPSPTEIILRGVNKQSVGEVAAKIRAYRPPEPYKGKGVRYSDEVVLLKEVKKK